MSEFSSGKNSGRSPEVFLPDVLMNKLDGLGQATLDQISAIQTQEALEEVRISVLGKKGSLSEVLKSLGSVEPSQRPQIGAQANAWKQKIEDALLKQNQSIQAVILERKLQTEKIDVTAPARLPVQGSLHLLTQVTRRIIQVFERIGFDVTLGPEVETEFLNFEAVNIPKDHPARDMQDTFFIGPEVVLRTHTSPVQMRALRSQKWPVRILCPGAVYRCDSDATHSPMFHQIEGLWVDSNVRMSDLKGTLEYWARELFGTETKIRFRPSYFPFVEPGVEVDVSCFLCRKKVQAACRICKGSGWLEVLGAGMVHPKLFEVAGYSYWNPADVIQPGSKKRLTGFAFGIGVERTAMLLSQVPDLRLFFSGDLRLLNQF